MNYIYEDKESPYDTENRLQYRNRDGHVGMDVIIRCIDGIFYTGKFQLVSKLQKADNFDEQANMNKLKEFEGRLKNGEDA